MSRRYVVLGGSYRSGNLGLHALTTSLIEGILAAEPDAEITVCDFVWRSDEVVLSLSGGAHRVRRCGLNPSRRIWSPTALTRVRLALRRGFLRGETARRILGADAVFDLSGGDSFTDLYGDQRFEFICQTKEMVLDAGCPLILPPQTFGPYADKAKRARVAKILVRAQQVWARDQPSLQRADHLLGEFGHSPRCRLGVDLAFALSASSVVLPSLSRTLDEGGLVVGMNVSGLVWHCEGIEARKLGTACDYRTVVVQGIRDLLSSGVDQLLLVPHVLEAQGSNESDPAASAAVMERLPTELQERVVFLIPPFGPEAAKALMSRCAWFAGTRMHATIGALSMGVPTTALAYSLKFQGVFDLVGMGHRVIDLRESSTSVCLQGLHEGFNARQEDRVAMAPGLHRTKVRALSQVADMLVNASI